MKVADKKLSNRLETIMEEQEDSSLNDLTTLQHSEFNICQHFSGMSTFLNCIEEPGYEKMFKDNSSRFNSYQETLRSLQHYQNTNRGNMHERFNSLKANKDVSNLKKKTLAVDLNKTLLSIKGYTCE